MKDRTFDSLIISSITTLFLLFLVLKPLNNSPFMTILGIIFLLFTPGYSLLLLLLPRDCNLSPLGKLALSLGLSLSLAVIVGLPFRQLEVGVRFGLPMCSLTTLTLLSALINLLRRRDDRTH